MLTLYSKETTSFSTLGIGVLRDFISHPLITEELNGAYTLEFEYAKDGYLSEYLIEQNIIKANGQAFRIWNIKKDMQKITVFAKHIFFDLSFNFLADVFPTNLTAQSALTWMLNRAAVATNFSATGNCTQTASTRYVRKNFIDAVFNEDNALLKKFGGELSYDNFNITVHEHRGTNANFSIRYKKNLTGIDFNLDFSNVATRIVPIGFDGLTIDSTYVESSRASNYFTPLYKTYEFNDIKYDPDDEEAYHTLAEAKQALTNAANDLFTKNVDLPQVSISVNFVELSKCSEYANYSNLETVHLGDTIDVIISELNIHTSARVNKTVYDCILDRFITLEIGSVKQSIARTQINIENQIRKSENYLTQAQQNAENLINHPFNGNVYIDKENGVIYLMDSTSPATAQNVWKWSLGGLGFSSTGINGTYTVAILQDGRINADFITTGQLNTGVIQGYDSLLIQVDTLDREFQKEINPTDTASGSSITLEDSAETELIDFELEGNTTQETRSGKNLFNLDGEIQYESSGAITIQDGVLDVPSSSGNGSSILFAQLYNGSTYTLSFERTRGATVRIYVRVYDENGNNQNNVSIDGFSTYNGAYAGYWKDITSTSNSVTFTIASQYNFRLAFVYMNFGIKNIQLEQGNQATSYEQYGAMPSPDYPSELVSVGYENLLISNNTTQTINGVDFTHNDNGSITMNKTATAQAVYRVNVAGSEFSLSSGTYTISLGTNLPTGITFYGWQSTANNFLTISPGNNKATFTSSGYTNIRFQFVVANGTTINNLTFSVILTKGSQAVSYIPYGKYGIEVKTTGKNLFNYADTASVSPYTISCANVKPNTSYYAKVYNVTGTYTGTYAVRALVNGSWVAWNAQKLTDGYSFTTPDGCTKIGFNGLIDTNVAICQVEEGTQPTTYEPYKSNTYLYTLDQPLRSIGDIKDLLYIKNGYLYVDRKIGSVIYDGTESGWNAFKDNLNHYNYWKHDDNIAKTVASCKSNYFKYQTGGTNQIGEFQIGGYNPNKNGNIIFNPFNDTTSDLSTFKTWLSTHNTEVQYPLAEPYTETLGAIEVPSTYKGITYLNTTDELEPIMNISYVRDTLIANYVESHASELKITEKGIESRVQTIEESDYGGRINAVEERTTDTEKNIEIISTNIDTTTGEVRKVTTTNGMTFDENGLNIHTNQNEFNTQITNEATEYKDGNSLINKTSRDGSLLTKLRLQEQTYYSCNGSDTSNPMNTENFDFVDERVEVDGEYCYATFYNGEE